jgi:uncharacterized membrane protein
MGDLLVTVLLSSLFSVGLFAVRALAGDSVRYWFLNWNLLLAWLPLLFALALRRRLWRRPWLSMRSLVLTLLWLGFLPNSFYLVSDFIHLHESGEVSLLYDIVLFMSFTLNGFILGFSSIYLVHQELLKKIRRRDAHLIIAGVLLLSGFAIYLGRYQRWNTWDVLVNPAGLLFSVSDRFINPGSNPQMFTTTLMFFALLASLYALIWRFATILNLNRHS